MALVTGDAHVEGIASLATNGPLDTFLSALSASVEPLVREATAGIGVSVAGFVDDEGSAMIYNPNIPWLERVPLRREIQQRFGVPVAVDADSTPPVLPSTASVRGAAPGAFSAWPSAPGSAAG